MSVENPVRMIRKKLRLPTRAVPGIGQATVLRLEAGHYEELSDGMADALVEAVTANGVDFDVIAADLQHTFGTPYLSVAYVKWRRMHRAETGDRVTWPSLSRLGAGAESPMGSFARQVSGSVHQFCMDFCVQGPTLARYIRGEYNYLRPPQTIRQALEDARYPQIEELFSKQREWLDERP